MGLGRFSRSLELHLKVLTEGVDNMIKQLWERLSGLRTSILGAVGLGAGAVEPVNGYVSSALESFASVISGPGAASGGTALLFVVVYQLYKKYQDGRKSRRGP